MTYGCITGAKYNDSGWSRSSAKNWVPWLQARIHNHQTLTHSRFLYQHITSCDDYYFSGWQRICPGFFCIMTCLGTNNWTKRISNQHFSIPSWCSLGIILQTPSLLLEQGGFIVSSLALLVLWSRLLRIACHPLRRFVLPPLCQGPSPSHSQTATIVPQLNWIHYQPMQIRYNFSTILALENSRQWRLPATDSACWYWLTHAQNSARFISILPHHGFVKTLTWAIDFKSISRCCSKYVFSPAACAVVEEDAAGLVVDIFGGVVLDAAGRRDVEF